MAIQVPTRPDCAGAEAAASRSAEMRGQNIVCFAKDWDDDPTCCNHVMRELAKHNRVLWLNSVSTRSPKLSSGRDRGRIVRKLRAFFQGPRRVESDLWVMSPIVLPFPNSRLAARVNVLIIKWTIATLRRRLKMDGFQLWSYLPNIGEYAQTLGASVFVYYCVDEWSGFSNLDSTRIFEAERDVCRQADIVFTACQTLLDRKKPYNPETHLSTHGVDHEMFARALDPDTAIPDDIADLRGPILGFFGTLDDWVDLPLVAFLARRNPDWNIVLIGKTLIDMSSVAQFPNVHVLGRRSHDTLPAYCKAFSVGIIPYLLVERMKFVNPKKLREYLSAGLPVVSTDFPEVRNYPERCAIGETPEEFERKCSEAIAADSPQERRTRSDEMIGETWDNKVAWIASEVMRVKAARAR